MNKLTTAGLAAFAALGFAAPALAVEAIDLSCNASGCTGAYDFGPIALGDFTEQFTFSLPDNGIFGGSVTTEFSNPNQNINFTSIIIDGVSAYTRDLTVNEPQERWSIANLVIGSGPHTIEIKGNSAGFGVFAGTVSFAAAAVPEPATWAFMILGFGLIGGTLRRRQKVTVSYA